MAVQPYGAQTEKDALTFIINKHYLKIYLPKFH